MEEFSCKTKLICGSGAVSRLADFQAKRLFLVSDPFFVKNGTAQKIADGAKCSAVEIFDKIQPDPTVELAAEGTAKLREFGPDLVVALGGGSTLDCAKAMAYFAKGTYTVAAIPTTSGSGSEVTDFAILTHNKVKHPLVDPRLRPDVAILDSDLLQELPQGLIAETGFDVLTHALEAYVARDAGAVTDLLAREAFSSAYAALPASYAGNREVRLKVHLASTMAGMAFTQAGLNTRSSVWPTAWGECTTSPTADSTPFCSRRWSAAMPTGQEKSTRRSPGRPAWEAVQTPSPCGI